MWAGRRKFSVVAQRTARCRVGVRNRNQYANRRSANSGGAGYVKGAFVVLFLALLSFALGFFVLARLLPDERAAKSGTDAAASSKAEDEPVAASAADRKPAPAPRKVAAAPVLPAAPKRDDGPVLEADDTVQTPTTPDTSKSGAAKPAPTPFRAASPDRAAGYASRRRSDADAPPGRRRSRRDARSRELSASGIMFKLICTKPAKRRNRKPSKLSSAASKRGFAGCFGTGARCIAWNTASFININRTPTPRWQNCAKPELTTQLSRNSKFLRVNALFCLKTSEKGCAARQYLCIITPTPDETPSSPAVFDGRG